MSWGKGRRETLEKHQKKRDFGENDEPRLLHILPSMGPGEQGVGHRGHEENRVRTREGHTDTPQCQEMAGLSPAHLWDRATCKVDSEKQKQVLTKLDATSHLI